MAALAVKRVGQAICCAVKPTARLVSGLVADLTRSRTELLTEKALLRQQLIVPQWCATRPQIRPHERAVMVVLAAHTRTARREYLDHVLILSERHVLRVSMEHVAHFNRGRPHQGIDQRVPTGLFASAAPRQSGQVVAHPVLGGLHHDYRWTA